jgi:hypothetical protein
MTLFTIDKGKAENCGVLSLAHQYELINQATGSNTLPTTEQEIRDTVKNYMVGNASQLASSDIFLDILAAVESDIEKSGNQIEIYKIGNIPKLVKKCRAGTGTSTDKELIVQYRGLRLGQTDACVDTDFFAIMNQKYPTYPIAIICGDEYSTDPLKIHRHFGHIAEQSKTAYIYDNHTTNHGQGLRFKSTTRDPSIIDNMMTQYKDAVIDKFCTDLRTVKADNTPAREVLLQKTITTLKDQHPEVFEAILRLMQIENYHRHPYRTMDPCLLSFDANTQYSILLDYTDILTPVKIKEKIQSMTEYERTHHKKGTWLSDVASKPLAKVYEATHSFSKKVYTPVAGMLQAATTAATNTTSSMGKYFFEKAATAIQPVLPYVSRVADVMRAFGGDKRPPAT